MDVGKTDRSRSVPRRKSVSPPESRLRSPLLPSEKNNGGSPAASPSSARKLRPREIVPKYKSGNTSLTSSLSKSSAIQQKQPRSSSPASFRRDSGVDSSQLPKRSLSAERRQPPSSFSRSSSSRPSTPLSPSRPSSTPSSHSRPSTTPSNPSRPSSTPSSPSRPSTTPSNPSRSSSTPSSHTSYPTHSSHSRPSTSHSRPSTPARDSVLGGHGVSSSRRSPGVRTMMDSLWPSTRNHTTSFNAGSTHITACEKEKSVTSSHLASKSPSEKVQTNGVLTLKHLLKGHETPVMMLAWSPDNRMILTCGLEDVVRSWDIETGECAYVYAKSGVNIISCGWFPDGKSIITGMSDHSICKWESGKEVSCWKGERTILISDIVVTTNGKWMITISKPNRILLFDNETNTEKVIDEDQAITSFSLSRNNNFLLVNVLNEEIHLWRIKSDLKFVGKFVGHVRSRFVIRSCFGGVDDHFVASGSEDSQVYIWHLKTFHLVTKLPGHSGTVNCVTWNPVNPHMLASGSDDHTIRIWGIDNNDDNEANASDPKRKGLAIMKNKTTHANGNSK